MSKSYNSLKPLFNTLLFVALVVPVVFFLWYQMNIRAVDPAKTQEVVFVVPKFQPARVVFQRLKDAGLVQSALATRLYLAFSHQDSTIQAGSFKISPAMSVQGIIEELRHGTLDTWVTIPEGWRSEQIVEELVGQGLLRDIPLETLYQEFMVHEGYLFPDTYLFALDSNSSQIIEVFTETFNQRMTTLAEHKNQRSITRGDLVLASLIEREAKHNEDRPLIASVLTNRLQIGMPLQVDATLQYARASAQKPNHEWWPIVTPSDKSILSAFNTYLYGGLPPTPIANPGIASIRAALSPAKTEYLYYLSDQHGVTHYAKTFQEHQQNIHKYLGSS